MFSCIPQSINKGRQLIKVVIIFSIRLGSISISIGIASVKPCTNPNNNCVPISIIKGIFSNRILTTSTTT